jgi:simple sugar transport system permease protein
MLEYLLDLAAATLRLSTPLIFAAMGGLISERSGVINIALEGKMVVGAFAAAVVTLSTGSPWVGLIGGGLAGVLLAALYGVAVLPLRANQIVAGTGINMLAFGIPPFVAKILYDVTGSTPAISLAERFSVAPMFLAVLLPLVIWSFLSHTRGGLWLQFAGEHPAALAAAGVTVRRVRWASVLTAGFLAGVGGATLSIFLSSAYSRNMTSGRGFIALAALILGKWRPVPVLFACLFFGLADAVQMRLQGIQMDGFGKVPVQFIQILPYMITIVVLAGFVGRSRAPRALGNS